MTIEDQGSIVNVSYTVKELFEDIKRELENLSVKLDSKADRVELLELSREVANIRTQFVALQNAVTEVETTNTVHVQAAKAQEEWKRWVVPTLMTLALLALGVIQSFR
jgi:hypothetical protein